MTKQQWTMGMLTMVAALVVGGLFLAGIPQQAFAGGECATCIGATPCRACKNCKYCRYCKVQGNKCGVCR